MTRTVDDVIADVRVRASGRTRFNDQMAFEDEMLVAEIEALRAAVRDANTIGVTIMPEPWRRKHAATIARAVAGRT